MDVNAIVAFANAMPELLDTIELLTKERDEAICSSAEMTGKYRFLNDRFNETRDHLRASLSEAQDTYQKTYDDLAAARAEVEQQRKHIGGLEYHLEAARSTPRCKLCGVLLDGDRKQFCSTCCAQ